MEHKKDETCFPQESNDLIEDFADDGENFVILLSEDGEARRRFLIQSLIAGGGFASAYLLLNQNNVGLAEILGQPTRTVNPAITIPVSLKVNGTIHQLQLEPQTTLLDAVRERIGLTGSKKGCDRGQCGACTVLANGHRINSCLALAAAYDGVEITTIEGLANGNDLHPLQEAFIKHDGFQCGYCTPGQIMSGVGVLKEGCPSGMSIRDCMSGNICRCGAYNGIFAAIEETLGPQSRI